jgi:UDP-N-acetylglucosamine acyltransferase
MNIHPTAIVHSGTRLGKDVVIDAYAVIGPNVSLGDRCHIWPHTNIEYTTLGNDCQVYPQVSLGLPPQHMGDSGDASRVVIGERCIFREGVTVHRGTKFQNNVTIVGNDGYFMALSHIAHDCQVGNNVIMANGAQLAGHVVVADRCFISATVGIHQFVRIGVGALVSGGAMVPLDVAPYTIAQGDRAVLRGLNIVGMRRAGLSRQSIKAVKQAYKAIFLSGLPLNEALQHSDVLVEDPHVVLFRTFLQTPKRGFVRPSLKVPLEDVEEVAS